MHRRAGMAADKGELLQAPAQPALLQAPAQSKRIAAARRRSEIKRAGRKRKAHKEELHDEHPLGPRDGQLEARGLHETPQIDEAELEQVGWGGYGIEHGQVSPEFKITSEDDADGE